MIDDTIKAYVLVGIRYRQDQVELLRFDPHIYDGPTKQDYDALMPDGGRGVKWIKASTVFRTSTGRWLIFFPQTSIVTS